MLATSSAADGLFAAVEHLNSTARDRIVRVWLLACSDVDAAAWRRLVEAEKKRRQRASKEETQRDIVPLEQGKPTGQTPPVPLEQSNVAGQPEKAKEERFQTSKEEKPSKKIPFGEKKASLPTKPQDVPLPAVLAALPLFPAAWADFLESRRLIREPMTHLAAERRLTRLAERPADAVAAVNLCIENRWQGFQWDWFDKDRPKNGSNGHHAAQPRAEPTPTAIAAWIATVPAYAAKASQWTTWDSLPSFAKEEFQAHARTKKS